MNIVPKFQRGGASYFTVYQAMQTPQVQAPQKLSKTDKEALSIKDSSKDDDKKDDDKGKLTEKDLFSMIKEVDGLPNEMKSIIANLKRSLATENLIGVDTGQLATTYLDSLYKLKVANQNKTKFDEVVKDAKENGSLGEAAITLDGNLMVLTKDGQVGQVTLDQYQENKDKYRLLTNSNLAWFRKYDPKYAFAKTDTAFEIISNGMGYESFQKLLDQAKTALGSYKYEEQGIADKKEALLGLKTLQGKSKEEQAKIINSITSNNLEYTTSQESNVDNVKSLMEYLIKALPERAKVWANLKTGKTGNQGAIELIGNYLTSNIKQNNSLHIDLPKGKGDKSGSGDSDTLDKMEANTPSRFLNGVGPQSVFVLNPGTNRAIQVVASTMPLTNAEGKPVGANSTMLDAVNGEYNGILDFNHATIGGQTVDSSAFGSIILKDGKISSIDYPCTIKDNGDIVPNTSPKIAEAKQEAEKYLRQKGVDVRKEADIKKYWKAINLAYKKFGLQDAYNSDGQPIGNWRRFGVINVTASDKALHLDEMQDNPLLKEVTNDGVIDNLIQITKDENFNKKGTFNSITNSYNRFYEGTMWIPLDVNYQAASVTTKMNYEQLKALEQAQQARDARASLKPAHSI